MRRSTDRILTTHTGSLPRRADLAQLVLAREAGEDVNQAELERLTGATVAEVVKHQQEAGVDVISDGEASKPGFVRYVKERLAGFSGVSETPQFGDIEQFPSFASRRSAEPGRAQINPACEAPITLADSNAVHRDLENFKGLVYAASFVSFAVPGVLRAIGWIFLLGPQSGAINQVFRRLTQARGPLIDIFTLPAMILVEGLAWVPVVFLMLAVTFRSMDAALEEAAMMSGAAMAQTLRRVTIRLAFPAIVAAGLLTFIRSTQAFEVPLLLGVPGKVSVLTTKVYLAMRSGILPDYSGPSAYGTLLVLFLVGFIYLYSRAVRSGSKYVTVTGKGFRPRVLELGAARYVAAAFVVLVVGLQFLPVAYLTFASFLRGFGLSGSLFSQLTLTNYVQTLANPNVAASLFNSFSIGATTATVVVMQAAVVAWILIRGRTAGRAVLDQLASLPLIFPGVVLGLAVLTLYISAPVRVYGTIWILVIAYVISFLPYGLRYAHVGLLQISPELEESGQVGGGTWGQVFLRIVVPLLLPALVAAWIFVFLLSIRELSAAALLYTATSPVVASTMLDLWQNANSNQVSAFGSIVSVLSIGLALVAYRLGRRWGIQT